MEFFTHRTYFRKYNLTVAEYGEILIAQMFGVAKMPDAQPGFDVQVPYPYFVKTLRELGDKSNGLLSSIEKDDLRIEVKSKLCITHSGEAEVIKVSEVQTQGKTKANGRILLGMTHLAVVIVFPRPLDVSDLKEHGRIQHAWLMACSTAESLRKTDTKSRYIPVKDVREKAELADGEIVDCTVFLNEVADKPLGNFSPKDHKD